MTAHTSTGPSELLADRYRLIEPIGSGGSSEVWRAHDERLDRDVAVKLLHRHLLPDAASRARFVAEARAAGALAHPAIVPVYDVVEDDERAGIVFQLVGGETLADRIEGGHSLAPGLAAALARQLAAGLAHAHERGVVHRDVKPANVVLTGDGRAMLVDFGIAQMLEDARSSMTATGEVMGTLRYLSPEQLGGGRVDGRSDLFAVGLVLYEMLAGAPAFPASTPIALVAAHADGPAPLPDDVPPELAALTTRLLELDPSRRPASAADVEATLAEISRQADSADSSAPPARAIDRSTLPGSVISAASDAETQALRLPEATGPVPALGTRETPGPSPARPRSPRNAQPIAMAAGIAGVALLAALLLAAGVFGSGGRPGETEPVVGRPAVAAPTDATPKPTAKPTPKPVVNDPGPPRHHKGKGHGRGN